MAREKKNENSRNVRKIRGEGGRLTGVESRSVIAAVIEIKLLLSGRRETFSMRY